MSWTSCKNLLCIRLDNMGDVLMSVPAMRALKESFKCRITLLTSSLGRPVTPYIAEIDQVIVYDAPWMKMNAYPDPGTFVSIAQSLRAHAFDAAVIFTVCSQNPTPAIMIAWLAAIPLRLAYCRENPYGLLTHWVPDEEPYSIIRHQVLRDLRLVNFVGATTEDQRLSITLAPDSYHRARKKMAEKGIHVHQPWMILHPGVSEMKREFPADQWTAAGKLLHSRLGYQLLLTGSASQRDLAGHISQQIGHGAFSMAGEFDMEEFMALIAHAPVVITVNTATAHIAAATGTPVLVLYAATNPQHTPWMAKSAVLYYDVSANLQSRNEVVKYMQRYFRSLKREEISAELILGKVSKLLIQETV